MPDFDYKSFMAGLQVGRRIRLWDASANKPPMPPTPSGRYILMEDGTPIVSELTTGNDVTFYNTVEWYLTEGNNYPYKMRGMAETMFGPLSVPGRYFFFSYSLPHYGIEYGVAHLYGQEYRGNISFSLWGKANISAQEARIGGVSKSGRDFGVYRYSWISLSDSSQTEGYQSIPIGAGVADFGSCTEDQVNGKIEEFLGTLSVLPLITE